MQFREEILSALDTWGGHLGALPVPPFALEDGSLCHAEKEQGPPAVEEVPP